MLRFADRAPHRITPSSRHVMHHYQPSELSTCVRSSRRINARGRKGFKKGQNNAECKAHRTICSAAALGACQLLLTRGRDPQLTTFPVPDDKINIESSQRSEHKHAGLAFSALHQCTWHRQLQRCWRPHDKRWQKGPLRADISLSRSYEGH